MTKAISKYESFIADLDQVGLNLCAVFKLAELPDKIGNSIPEHVQEGHKSLVLIGTSGSHFWQYLKTMSTQAVHPFDEISQRIALELMSEHYPGAKRIVIYPSKDYVVPLQRLGHKVGWGRPSILGLDIHPDYGTWFAYRTALLISESLPVTAIKKAPEVCEVCVEKPCQQACPVNAVTEQGEFNITACMGNRVKSNSECADKCLARLACPVGDQYRYSAEHLAHHSQFSLASIKRYVTNQQW